MINYNNRFSNIDPEVSDVKLEKVIEEEVNIESDKFIEELLESNVVLDEEFNLYDDIMESFNEDIERDMYADCINNDERISESVRLDIINEDNQDRCNRYLEKLDKVSKNIKNVITMSTTSLFNNINDIQKFDNKKYSKYKTNLLKKDSLEGFKGIKNQLTYNSTSISKMNNLGELKAKPEDIPSIAKSVFTKVDRYKPESISKVANYLDTNYTRSLAAVLKTALSTIDSDTKKAKERISSIRKDENCVRKTSEIYRDACNSFDGYLKLYKAYCRVYKKMFKIDRQVFIICGTFATSTVFKHESTEIQDMTFEQISETSSYFIDTKFGTSYMSELADMVVEESNNKFNELLRAIGIDEYQYFEENHEFIVYEKHILAKLIDRVKETAQDIANGMKEFWKRTEDRFRTLNDTNISAKISKVDIAGLADGVIVGSTHEYFKAKELDFAKNAQSYAKSVCAKFKKADSNPNTIVEETKKGLYKAISGLNVSSLAELKEALTKELTGNQIEVDKDWLMSNFNTFKVVVNGDAYTNSIIKQSQKADKKLFDDIANEIDSIDEDKYASLIGSWGKCLVEISTVCHICYAVAMDVYRHQYIEYRNIAVKVIRESK